MNMNEKYHKALPSFELILDYLDGILDTEASQRLEIAIQESDELKSIIEGISLYYESEGKDRKKLEAYVEQVRFNQHFKTPNSSVNQSVGRKRSSSYYLKIAASIVLALMVGLSVIYFVMSQNDAANLIADHLNTPYDAPEIFRSSENSDELIWNNFALAYQNQDFENAILLLNEFPDSVASMMNVKFYKGMCHLYKKPPQLSKTIEFLTEVSESDHRLKEQADWFLAIAYFKNWNRTEALKKFEEISRSNLYKNKEAKEFIELLSD